MVEGFGSAPTRLRADAIRAPTALRSWLSLLALVVAAVASAGCTDPNHAPPAASSGDGKTPSFGGIDRCATPQAGCACDDPGKIVACGQTTLRSGDYVTCSEGKRICTSEQTWSECAPDHVTQRFAPEAARHTLALSDPAPCNDPCDPLCREVVDTASGLDLTGNLCVVGAGLGVCTGCGYTGPHGTGSYDSLPAAWQRLPPSCDSDSDCSFDTRCVDEVCQRWGHPCHDTTESCLGRPDLVLGPPCIADGGDTYHIQVCNRGGARAQTGDLRIGLYRDSARVGQCGGPELSAPGAEPDAGIVTFTFDDALGRTLEPGACLDIHNGNSDAAGLDVGALRAVAANYDGNADVGECNTCNNWNVLDPAAECSGCRGIQCSQICEASTVTGTVYDPAGRTPLPNVAVYIPLDELAAFPDGRSCDRCSDIYSGSPLVSTVTRPDGTFTLTNVPSRVNFEIVVQTGRWRRRVRDLRLDAVDANGCGELDVGAVRLPTVQERCVGTCPEDEPPNLLYGDIPQMALVLTEGDPLQCLLRKIGIAEREFTAPSGGGRVHLFNHNGMQKPDAPGAFSGDGALLDDPAQLDQYNAVFAPCDVPHRRGGGERGYSERRTAEGPAFNNHPDTITSREQQAIMKAYVDRGGRLFATHWMSLDFVYTNFNPPEPGPPSGSQFVTPAQLFGFETNWRRHPATQTYNPAAPVRFLFGANVDRGGNNNGVIDRIGRPFDYQVDLTSDLGRTFAAWGASAEVGAVTPAMPGPPATPPTVRFSEWSQLVDEVRAPAIRLAYGDTRAAPHSAVQESCVGSGDCLEGTWGAPHTAMFQFETPWARPAAENCGRVVVAESHAAQSAPCPLTGCSTDPNAPPNCRCLPRDDDALRRANGWEQACGSDLTLTPEEKAFEFLIFSTTQCSGPIVPPPSPVNLEPGEFVRDYEATCGPEETPVWRHFAWQAVVPGGTSIAFSARTAEKREDLDTAPAVSIGTADDTTAAWESLPETVDDQLRAGTPPQASRRWLRVRMRFSPLGTATPTLTTWRQVFDCVP